MNKQNTRSSRNHDGFFGRQIVMIASVYDVFFSVKKSADDVFGGQITALTVFGNCS